MLVVDDEKLIVKGIRFSLLQDDMEVDCAYDGEEALNLAKSNAYDMILLDVMLPALNGLEVLRRLRKESSVPVIMLTARDAVMDKVSGLDAGADDYIRKPFSMKELMARVKNALKRTQLTPRIVEYQGLKLDKDSRLFSIDGEKVDLTKKEFELMKLFLTNMDRIFTREEILDNIWGKNIYVVDRTIDVNINRLRKKLGVYGKNIETKLGYGYGFFK